MEIAVYNHFRWRDPEYRRSILRNRYAFDPIEIRAKLGPSREDSMGRLMEWTTFEVQGPMVGKGKRMGLELFEYSLLLCFQINKDEELILVLQ